MPCSPACLASQILASPCSSDIARAIRDEFTARVNLTRIALHLPAFEHRKVTTHVVRSSGDQVFGLRVPEYNVRIGTSGNSSLLRVHAEDPCRRRRGNLDKS